LFTSKAEKERLAELDRQRIIAKLSNSINFEINRETTELNKRLQGAVYRIVEREITKKLDDLNDDFC
jgi:hypothetical protein